MNKENLINELRYALPSSRILQLVSLAIVKVGEEILVLKSRPGFKDDELLFVKEFSNNEADYLKLHKRSIEIHPSAFNMRGQNAIVEYLSTVESAPTQPFSGLDKKLEEKKLIELDKEMSKWFTAVESGREIEDVLNLVTSMFGNPWATSGKSTQASNLGVPRGFPASSPLGMLAKSSSLKSDVEKEQTKMTPEKQLTKMTPEKQLRLDAIIKPPMTLFESANSVVLLLNGKMQVLKSRGKIDLENIDFIVYDEETMHEASPIFFMGKDFLIIPKKLPQKNTK